MSCKRILLRRYLCRRLAEYYSQPADSVVGSIGAVHTPRIQSSGSRLPTIAPRSINFASLLNEWHWKRTYARVYEEQRGMWLTPVELFFPYYSNILANFVSQSMSTTLGSSHDGIFEIVELGGGRGTNAKALLDHLSECHPDMYDRLHSYTIFDTSPTLHELQRRVLMEESKHSDKVKLFNVDMMDVAEGKSEFLSPSDTPTSVIALELLDNLPHDKIARCLNTGGILQAEVAPTEDPDIAIEAGEETAMPGPDRTDTSQEYREIFSPLNDPLLERILSVAPSLYTPMASHGPRWIPTVALGILSKVFECRPNASVAFADFDWLPPPNLVSEHFPSAEPAPGDPLVTDMEGNDHSCYLTSPPDALCDILFPTDFAKLAACTNAIHAAIAKSQVGAERPPISAIAMKQNDFLMKYGSDEVNKTKGWTGYSPMVQDFGNCSVLAVAPDAE